MDTHLIELNKVAIVNTDLEVQKHLGTQGLTGIIKNNRNFISQRFESSP